MTKKEIIEELEKKIADLIRINAKRKTMTKKEIVEAITEQIEKIPEGGSFIFGYGTGVEFIRAGVGDMRDILLLCEQIKIDAFNKQAKKGE